MNLLAGDVVLFRGNSLISRLIRWVTRDAGEAKTIVNHCGIMINSAELVEAKTRTIRRVFIYPKNCWVYRKSDLTPGQRKIIVTRAQGYVGMQYGWLKIVAHAVDHLLFRDKYVARRLCRLDNYPICSWLVAYAYDGIGYQFGVPPWACTPDDIDDWIKAYPSEWTQVYPSA